MTRPAQGDGIRLRRARQAMNLTLGELAERWGLSATHLGRMERGELPVRPVYLDAAAHLEALVASAPDR